MDYQTLLYVKLCRLFSYSFGVDKVDSANVSYQFIALYQEKLFEFRHKHFSPCLISIETTVFALSCF
jgi:hypothetical protein